MTDTEHSEVEPLDELRYGLHALGTEPSPEGIDPLDYAAACARWHARRTNLTTAYHIRKRQAADIRLVVLGSVMQERPDLARKLETVPRPLWFTDPDIVAAYREHSLRIERELQAMIFDRIRSDASAAILPDFTGPTLPVKWRAAARRLGYSSGGALRKAVERASDDDELALLRHHRLSAGTRTKCRDDVVTYLELRRQRDVELEARRALARQAEVLAEKVERATTSNRSRTAPQRT